jgi:hypothetical protein
MKSVPKCYGHGQRKVQNRSGLGPEKDSADEAQQQPKITDPIYSQIGHPHINNQVTV